MSALLRAVDRIARDWRAYIVVAFIALCASLPGITQMPVMDVDEARFAQASRQMLETGDFVRIRLQENERNRKPAGVHWLQAAATAALEPITGVENAIWTYRLPSVLGAILAALATLWAGRALFGPRTALLGASLLASGLLFGFEGMTAKTDALMLGFTTLAIAALAQLRASALGFAAPLSHTWTRVTALVFWAALGCAIMIKGPIPIMIVALTLLAITIWDRRAGWLAPLGWLAGPLLALLIVSPWGIAIGLATEWRFYTNAFVHDLAPKLAGEDHAHGGVFGYHLALLPLLLFPATFALPAAARLLFAKAPTPGEHATLRFLIAWAGPAWLVFELSPAKLVHYAMPVYPAIALLCAAGFVAAAERNWRKTLGLGVVLFVLAGSLLSAGIGYGLYMFGVDLTRVLTASALAALIVVLGAGGLVLLKQPFARAGAAMACALLLSFALRGAILPGTPGLRLSAEAAAALGPLNDGRALWVVGYDEPSIIFMTRTDARLGAPDVAGAEAQAGDHMLVSNALLSPLEGALARRGLQFAAHAAPVAGLSMSSGETLALHGGAVETAPRPLAASAH